MFLGVITAFGLSNFKRLS